MHASQCVVNSVIKYSVSVTGNILKIKQQIILLNYISESLIILGGRACCDFSVSSSSLASFCGTPVCLLVCLPSSLSAAASAAAAYLCAAAVPAAT